MKEQLERDIEDIKNDIEHTESALYHMKHNSADDGRDKIVKILKSRTGYLQGCYNLLSNTKEERTFKNKDFHVKVWQDSEKIGIETVWIREGFKQLKGIWIKATINTYIYNDGTLPNIGMERPIYEVVKTPNMLPYSDIVTELEKAHKLSSEVTIYDVIKECEGVTDWNKVYAILSKYVFINDYGKTLELNINTDCLTDPYHFIRHGYQLRLKEGE